MRTPRTAPVCPEHSQLSRAPVTSERGSHLHLNALKHGMRSTRVVLPREDAADFRRQRFDLFARYQPSTLEEARAVEDMIAYEWRKGRCQRWAEAIDNRLDPMWCGDAEAERHCNGDPHRWTHHSMDCEKKETRLERLMKRAKLRLMALQKERRNNLIPGAMDGILKWQDLEREGAARLGLLEEPGPAPEASDPAPAADTTPGRPASDATASTAEVTAEAPKAATPQRVHPAPSTPGHRRKSKNAKRNPMRWEDSAPRPAA